MIAKLINRTQEHLSTIVTYGHVYHSEFTELLIS